MAALVYIAAFAPDKGESVNTLLGDAPAGAPGSPILLIATEDHMIPPSAQRAMAQRAGATTVDVAGSHAVYISQPATVADLIRQARV